MGIFFLKDFRFKTGKREINSEKNCFPDLIFYKTGLTYSYQTEPKWRNGRRTRLKIWRWRHRVGSSPTFGTNFFLCFPGFILPANTVRFILIYEIFCLILLNKKRFYIPRILDKTSCNCYITQTYCDKSRYISRFTIFLWSQNWNEILLQYVLNPNSKSISKNTKKEF